MIGSGLLLFDKPTGWTSAKAVSVIKRYFSATKVGHAGTLDPLATGLLIIGIGEGTKVLHYLTAQSKCYEARVVLGEKTTTGDSEGQVVSTCQYRSPDEKSIEDLLHGFLGEIQQIPPMYSAIKVGGKRLYQLARANRVVEREPRSVTIHSLKLKQCLADGFCFEVHCSKGTYVRTLAEDIGVAFGTVAHLAALRRTGSGEFRIDDAVDMQTLDAYRCDPVELSLRLLPVDAGLMHFPSVKLEAAQSARMRQGGEIALRDLPRGFFCAKGDLCRVYDAEDALLSISVRGEEFLRPKRVFNRSVDGPGIH